MLVLFALGSMEWRGGKDAWDGVVVLRRFGFGFGLDTVARGKLGVEGLWSVEDSRLRYIYTVASSLDLVLRISRERRHLCG